MTEASRGSGWRKMVLLAVAAAVTLVLGSPSLIMGPERADGAQPSPSACSVEPQVFTGRHLFFGIVAPDVISAGTWYQDCSFGQMAADHLGFVRMELDWSGVELTPHNYDFTGYDGLITALAKHHLTWLPELMSPPSFRSKAPNATASGVWPPTRSVQFAGFAYVVAKRYGPGGTFWKDNPQLPYYPVHTWQVWNEPNLDIYWMPHANPAQYASLLRLTAVAIRKVDPTARIIAAGMPFSSLGMPILTFLKKMYQDGARRYFNALALHAYAPTPAAALARMEQVRKLMNHFRDRRKQLWITEFGWASGGPPSSYTAGRKQPTLVASLIADMKRARRGLNLGAVFYYDWRDMPPVSASLNWWGLHTGIYLPKGHAKPLARVIAAAAALLNG